MLSISLLAMQFAMERTRKLANYYAKALLALLNKEIKNEHTTNS